MSLSRPVLIKVRTLSICFIIVELTSADSTSPEGRRGPRRDETRREGEQMSVKVMRANLADTRSKVSLAPSDRLRLDACALFGRSRRAIVSSALHSHLIIIAAARDEVQVTAHCESAILIEFIAERS